MRLKLVFPTLVLCLLAGSAFADEEAVKKALQATFSGEKIDSVKKTTYLGLYEVVVGGELFYTDEKATYLFFGHVVDPQTKQSLTSERLQQIKDTRRISMDTLPLIRRLKQSRATASASWWFFPTPTAHIASAWKRNWSTSRM